MAQIKYEHAALEETEENDGCGFVMVSGTMEVCPTCGGYGSHVRQDLDDSVMVDSMREDGDDEGLQAYFNGSFDEKCRQCEGKNVIMQPDWGQLPVWAAHAIEAWEDDERSTRKIEEQERRMGA